MKLLNDKVMDLVHLLTKGHHHKVRQTVRAKLNSNSLSLGLCRDLSVPFQAPQAKIPVTVWPIEPEENLSFLSIEKAGDSSGSVLMRSNMLRLLKAGIPRCYVALTLEGQPCYVQWLISSRDNDRIRSFFGDLFPRLDRDEALLEGAYSLDEFRGKGIMASAMAQIAEKASDFGARRVITFVGENNIASLKGCEKAGFSPYVKRLEAWKLFQRRIEFVPLSQETL